MKTNYRLDDTGLVPVEELSIVRFSSDERRRGQKHLATNAIDEDVTTTWRSAYIVDPAPPPHELVIDTGRKRAIVGFRYLAAQLDDRGQFAKTEFHVSDDPENFPAEPAARAAFIATKSPQAADCSSPVSGRYVLVRVLSEIDGKPSVTAAEIGIVEQSPKKAGVGPAND